MILVPALPVSSHLGYTSAANYLQTLAQELNATSIATFWAGTSFLLANASFVPLIGAMSDILGRRELLLSSVLLFTVGTIICCVSNNVEGLLAGRTIQGVSAGGIQTMSYAIVSDIIPLRQRPKYGNFTILAWGLDAVLGPVFGGVITEHTIWRVGQAFSIGYPRHTLVTNELDAVALLYQLSLLWPWTVDCSLYCEIED